MRFAIEESIIIQDGIVLRTMAGVLRFAHVRAHY